MIRLGLSASDLVRSVRVVIVVLAAVATSAAVPASAQTLTYSLFERYLDALRDQYGIPGLAAAVIDHGTVAFSSLGKQDVEAGTPVTPDTPYFVGNLSEVFGSTLLLHKCVEGDTLELTDRIVRWRADYQDQTTTVAQLLTHQSPGGGFAYDPARFAELTGVIEQCADAPYRHELAREVFAPFGMASSVPGQQLDGVAMPGRMTFSSSELAHYNEVLSRMARPYRLDRDRPVRSSLPSVAVSASTGVITSVRDLVQFDLALRNGQLLTPASLVLAWTQASIAGSTVPLPTGLGWFVQNYNNEAMVWQFDTTRDAGSSMIVKLPGRDLTFIMLANSDSATAQFGLASGDALASPFVRLFLRIFVP